MSGAQEQHDPDLERLVGAAVDEARSHVQGLEEAGRLISRHYRFPSLGTFDSGLPNVSHSKEIPDYGGAFRWGAGDQWTIGFEQLPGLAALIAYVREHRELRDRIIPLKSEDLDDIGERFLAISVARIPHELLDRLRHTAGPDFSTDDLRSAWQPLEAGLLWPRLPVEIVVPVALTGFSASERFALGDGISLEPLQEGVQLARVPERIWDAAAHQCVVSAATHAVVLDGYEIPGTSPIALSYGRLDFYPVDAIETVFQALRLATGAPTGFAQILMRPVGWAWSYKAHLPPVVSGAIARRYPPSFDNGGWLREPNIVGEDELRDTASVLRELQGASRAMKLAVRRFNNSALRDDEEDAVLDVCIGLEAALGDSSPTEMTQKLALRVAALLGGHQRALAEPRVLFSRVKRLYEWRSAIVHGRDTDEARERFASTASGASALDLATELLRDSLRELFTRPELRDPPNIDRLLLLDAIPQGPDEGGTSPGPRSDSPGPEEP